MQTPALLKIADLTAAYGDRPVLRGVSLALRAGEVVALIGPNGCGKTTLLRAALGQLPVGGSVAWSKTSGELRQVRSWRPRDLARRVAYLPQSPTLDPTRTVLDELRLGRSPHLGPFGVESPADARAVARVADDLGLTDLLDRPVDALSGGQRQRVYLGRCLAQEPAALLLDEPDTYLDLRRQADLTALLRRLADRDGLGVLMASHDLNLAASVADRLVLLSEGVVAAEGRPADVLTADRLSAAYGVAVAVTDRGDGTPVVYPVPDDIPHAPDAPHAGV